MPCSPARASRSALRRGPSRSGSGRSEELAPSESPSSRAAAAAPPRSPPPRTAGKVTLASLARAARGKRRSDHFLLAACAVHVFNVSSDHVSLQTMQFFRQRNSSDNATLQTTHVFRQRKSSDNTILQTTQQTTQQTTHNKTDTPLTSIRLTSITPGPDSFSASLISVAASASPSASMIAA